MTDVTAQAFREAAAQAQRYAPAYPDLYRMLLAAAEQREQLDQRPYENETHRQHAARLVDERQQQVMRAVAAETKCAEQREQLDKMRHMVANSSDNGLQEFIRAQQLIATLTSERDGLKGAITELNRFIDKVTAERDEYKAKFDRTRILRPKS